MNFMKFYEILFQELSDCSSSVNKQSIIKNNCLEEGVCENTSPYAFSLILKIIFVIREFEKTIKNRTRSVMNLIGGVYWNGLLLQNINVHLKALNNRVNSNYRKTLWLYIFFLKSKEEALTRSKMLMTNLKNIEILKKL